MTNQKKATKVAQTENTETKQNSVTAVTVLLLQKTKLYSAIQFSLNPEKFVEIMNLFGGVQLTMEQKYLLQKHEVHEGAFIVYDLKTYKILGVYETKEAIVEHFKSINVVINK